MRVLIAPTGSYGDVLPFLAIGREMQRRGHDVRVIAAASFERLVRDAGLAPIGIGRPEDYEAAIRHPDAFHPRRGVRLIASLVVEHLEETYDRIDQQIVPDETIIIASTLSFAARLFQETRAIPTASVHLSPSIFRSARNPPRYPGSAFMERLPAAANRLVFRLVDRLVVDPLFCPGFNRFRTRLGLAPITRLFHDWMQGADVVIGMFPRWFADIEPDWAGNVHLTGFPLFDRVMPAVPPDIERLLASRRPVVFTAGSAAGSDACFFEQSAEACALADADGLLVTRYPDLLPQPLPPRVYHAEHVAFSQLFPRCSAVVHHGGIGTMSQAMAAGIPQLLRPLAYDQLDNAARAARLGVGRTLAPRQYRSRRIAAALRELTGSPSVRAACLGIRQRLEGQDAVRATCDVILRELADRGAARTVRPPVSASNAEER